MKRKCRALDGIVTLVRMTTCEEVIKSNTQWRIQDFPEGGVNPPGGREHAKFSRKLHEIERIWTPRGGRASLTPPLDPPMIHVIPLITSCCTVN